MRRLYNNSSQANMIVPPVDVFTQHSSIYKTTEILEEFYIDKTFGLTTFVDPIHMLFNEKRLLNLGAGAIDALVTEIKSNMCQKDVNLQNALSGLKDSDIISMVKSRYIQNPCELKAYLESITDDVIGFREEVNRVIAERKALETAKEEPSPEVEPQSVS